MCGKRNGTVVGCSDERLDRLINKCICKEFLSAHSNYMATTHHIQ